MPLIFAKPLLGATGIQRHITMVCRSDDRLDLFAFPFSRYSGPCAAVAPTPCAGHMCRASKRSEIAQTRRWPIQTR